MNVLKINKHGFNVKHSLLPRAIFDTWLREEGMIVLLNTRRGLRFRWILGRWRAKKSLYRTAKKALRRRSPLAQNIESCLNRLPAITRTISILIIQKGYKDLYSVDTTQALVVVPRVILKKDYIASLQKKLGGAVELRAFPGLATRILSCIGNEAEAMFFKQVEKRKLFIDPDYMGIFLETDSAYTWKLNGTDGHYYYAFSTRHGKNLSNKRELRDFMAEMKEVLAGQKRYLKSLAPHQIFDIAQAIRG